MLLFEKKKLHYLLILEREEETNIDLLFHLFNMVCALMGDWTHNLGMSGQHSNQLGYPARALLKILSQMCQVD